jgi:EAL domain-containing protein (putative c-di-GMP-specific phosphodiesterase class I)
MESSKNNKSINKSENFGDWIPKKTVQQFFNYGNTKMSTFAIDFNIKISKVGKRIFYKYSDIVKLIDENIIQ